MFARFALVVTLFRLSPQSLSFGFREIPVIPRLIGPLDELPGNAEPPLEFGRLLSLSVTLNMIASSEFRVWIKYDSTRKYIPKVKIIINFCIRCFIWKEIVHIKNNNVIVATSFRTHQTITIANIPSFQNWGWNSSIFTSYFFVVLFKVVIFSVDRFKRFVSFNETGLQFKKAF